MRAGRPACARCERVMGDGGFGAGLSRDMDVQLERGVMTAEAHRVITTRLASKHRRTVRAQPASSARPDYRASAV